jgi:hypothetical protein
MNLDCKIQSEKFQCNHCAQQPLSNIRTRYILVKVSNKSKREYPHKESDRELNVICKYSVFFYCKKPNCGYEQRDITKQYQYHSDF